MISRKALPAAVTSYDFLKTAAVLLMVVDHLGYYFHPDDNWYRVFGRLCVPIWCFLIGYARTRTLEGRLWIGLAVLEIGRFAAGMPIFPVVILATFLFIRAFIDPVMRLAIRDDRSHILINGMLFFLAVPSFYLSEYGTVGFMLAMFGWAVRQAQDGLPAMTASRLNKQLGWSAVAFIFWETLVFGFDRAQGGVLAALVLTAMAGLTFFRPATFTGLDRAWLVPLRRVLRFGGRWTLEIYVVHVIVFQTIASMIDPARFPAFHFVPSLPG